MKTVKYFILILVLLFTYTTCDFVGLGNQLDLDGPDINILAPTPRKAISEQFTLEGDAQDESGIKRILITASLNNVPLVRRWQNLEGVWQVSDDNGATWQNYVSEGNIWDGDDKFAIWAVDINMIIGSVDILPGLYTFTVQAWDITNTTDENSLRTIVLIFDPNPPKVEIADPSLHNRYAVFENGTFDDPDLQAVHAILDNSDEWRDPNNIGKFITQGFDLRWQVEDQFDIRSLDIRFYRYDATIDQSPDTPLPSDFIFNYNINLPPLPSEPDPTITLRPNGIIHVPSLTEPVGFYNGGELRNPVTEKTTIMVVGVSVDAAGNVNEERILGYFVYWPAAVASWIVYSEGMHDPQDFPLPPDGATRGPIYGQRIVAVEESVFMIYPGRSIRATAFQAQGVSKITYTLFRVAESSDPVATRTLRGEQYFTPVYIEGRLIKDIPIHANARANGSFSTIFAWEILPPNRSAYYVLKATAYDTFGNAGAEYSAIFRVQDITFPDFPVPPSPAALIGENVINTSDNSITISGIVSDATEIESLAMAWINPASRNYAAMSQLAFFRDANFEGWLKALDQPAGGAPADETFYDGTNPNKVWNLDFTFIGEDPETFRQRYSYSIRIPLSQLNILSGILLPNGELDPRRNMPLSSQVFLFRAQNPDGKTTIITHAPTGDTHAPSIEITNVEISRSGSVIHDCEPGKYSLISQFQNGDRITINGMWDEDSTAFLNVQNFFHNYFNITINGYPVPLGNIILTPSTGTATAGINKPWTATVIVGSGFDGNEDNLKDTLVISVEVSDIGGNRTEVGSSWLIESDHLKFMRISAENPDETYNAGPDPIEIFLEFSKPVTLTHGGQPEIILNSTNDGTPVRARYRAGQTQASRHYFDYVVEDGDNTPLNTWLNVTGLHNPSSIDWNAANYPFTWSRGQDLEYEEIRITNVSTHNGDKPTPSHTFYARNLPVTSVSTNPDFQFTLNGGKNIQIDTTAPRVTSISTTTREGHYSTGSEIYITVRFDEAVTVGSTTPRLTLQVANGINTTVQTSANPNDVRVNGNDIIFVYTVAAGDTTDGNPIVVTDFTGDITDIAGTRLASTGITGFTGNKTLTNRFIDTIVPDRPIIRLRSVYNTSNIVTNNVNDTDRTGQVSVSAVDLATVYAPSLWLAFEASGLAHDRGRIEYQVSANGIVWGNWINAGTIASGNSVNIQVIQRGVNFIRAMQYDEAGNPSAVTANLRFDWDDGGNIVSRIDSTTAPGTYSHQTATNQINITLHFRRPVVFTNGQNQSVTLNIQRGGTDHALTMSNVTGSVSSLSFTYAIANNDNTPGTNPLDVTAISLIAKDAAGVDISTTATHAARLTVPSAAANQLAQRKRIIVQTGALELAGGTNPQITGTVANDEWTGTITFTFNRDIQSGSGNVTIVQDTAGYRLPAVLTAAQSSRYTSAPDFNTYYTRGTNGFVSGAPDTSTKFILNYTLSTIQTVPGTRPSAASLNRLAYDFHQAESVTLAATARQDVVVSGNTLTINVKGSNALQVLGANYTITIPAGFVQDSLSFTWPTSAYTHDFTLQGINRPFVRIDKKIDGDRITQQAGSITAPRLLANYNGVIETRARFDCRTPNSIVRYRTSEQAFTATEATSQAIHNDDGGGTTGGSNWRNAGDADTFSYLTAPDLRATGTVDQLGTFYNTFNDPDAITVGDNTQNGYVWRVAVMSRNSETGATTNGPHEEIAFRTVLTYQLNDYRANTLGQRLEAGDQLWIRGGNSIGASTVPGFPLTWNDDFNILESERRSAGVRLLQLRSVGNNFNVTSQWVYITWEINARTFFDIIMGRDSATNIPSANEAWQYGPRQWAYQRGGWVANKNSYTLYPGKHRWLSINNTSYGNGGMINFSFQMYPRAGQGVSYTQP